MMKGNVVAINEDTCIKCGLCARTCFCHKIEFKPGEGVKVLDDRFCMGCTQCAAACPTRSISINGVTSEKVVIPEGAGETVKSLVLNRRSIRNYKSDLIPKEKLEEILNAASTGCPSGCNTRRCHCTVITGKDKLYKIAENIIGKMEKSGVPQFKPSIEAFKKGINPITYNAPHLLVMWGRKMKLPFGEDSAEMMYLDTGIQAETVELLLAANGFGSVFIGFITMAGIDEELKRLLHVPEDAEPLICLGMGVPASVYPNASIRPPHPITFIE